jgi:hypothetical protein
MPEDDQFTVWAGAPRSLVVLANDGDDNGDPLEVVEVGRPSSGTAALADPETIVYSATILPVPGGHYTDVFTYTVSDGTLAASAWVTVVVRADNRPPVAVDDWATVGTDMVVAIPVLANDWDPDGDLLRVAGVGAAGHGTAITDGWVVTYTAPAGFTGQDTFPYRLSDGYVEVTGTVWVSVTGTVPTQSGSVVGRVYVDRNRNHLYEEDVDVPLAGVQVRLVPAGDGDPDGAEWVGTTDAQGLFQLTDIPWGSYLLELQPPPGYLLSTPGQIPVHVGPQGAALSPLLVQEAPGVLYIPLIQH